MPPEVEMDQRLIPHGQRFPSLYPRKHVGYSF
jgi:hypothetical protein